MTRARRPARRGPSTVATLANRASDRFERLMSVEDATPEWERLERLTRDALKRLVSATGAVQIGPETVASIEENLPADWDAVANPVKPNFALVHLKSGPTVYIDRRTVLEMARHLQIKGRCDC